MTYKCAAAELDYGGGKTVIWGDPKTKKREALFRALGRYVEALKGRYKTGTDVGTTYDDFIIALKETRHVGALPEEYGGGGNSGIITAFGVWKGMKAVAKELFGTDSLQGLTVAVQGLGKVGYHLVGHLVSEGARVIASDINQENADRAAKDYGITIVDPEEIMTVECDIFSPNALGAILNDESIPRLSARPLPAPPTTSWPSLVTPICWPKEAFSMHPIMSSMPAASSRFATNWKATKERAFRKAGMIYQRLLNIFAMAKAENISTAVAADKIAEERIETISRVRRSYVGE